ncbi:MAG TPA: APC family permease [Solirubrobacterales bacterium]
MESSSTAGSGNPPAAGLNLPESYRRKATGLVREIPLKNMIAFSISGATPVAVVLAGGLFAVFGAFPGANFTLDLILSIAALPLMLVVFSLMAATMPRAGGDYLFASRFLHPILGLFSHFGTYLGAALSIGFACFGLTHFGLSPAFAVIGTVTESHGFITASEDVAKSGWTFAIGSVLIIALSVLSIMGTATAMRWIAYGIYISSAAVVVGIVIMLFSSHQDFVDALNSTASSVGVHTDVFTNTVKEGAKGGAWYPSVSGYDVRNTIGAFYPTFTLICATFYGTFVIGEMRGAGKRQRQLVSMLASGLANGLLVLIGILIMASTINYNFMVAATSGFFGLELPATFTLFMAMLTNSVVAVILVLAFVLAIPCWLYGQLALCQRTPFALAFDGVLPKRFARVNARTHTPIPAIVFTMVLGILINLWASFSSGFLEMLAYIGVAGFLAPIFVGLSALSLYFRHKDLYRGSPAEWNLFGVPVLPIAACGAIGLGLFLETLIFVFHENLGVVHIYIPVLILLGLMAAAILTYTIAVRAQRDRGVDLTLVYRSIPAE